MTWNSSYNYHWVNENERKNEDLSILLKRTENEKDSLEKEISEIKREKEDLEEKVLINGKNSESIINEQGNEISQLRESLERQKEELSNARLDKENILKLCLEKEDKLAEIANEYQVALLKVEELSFVEEKYLKLLEDAKELQDNFQQKCELLSSKETEIEDLFVLKEKYIESMNKIKELEEAVALNLEQIHIKNMKIEEMNNIHSKNTDDTLKKIEELEAEIHYKNELIDSKVSEIEELNIIKEEYNSSFLKIKELEEDILTKSECLDMKDKMIEDLKVTLRENEVKLDKLEYENIEMKTKIEDGRNAVNVCLECEIMEEQVKDYEAMKANLMQTEQKLMDQTQKASDTLKMLSETEDNFDNMRVKKEKEIIKYKDTIQALQHEMKLLEIQVGETENLKAQIVKLQMNLKEVTLQNDEDLQRLKCENEKLKLDIEILKTQEHQPLANVDSKNLSGKKNKKISSSQIDNEIMEVDISHGIPKLTIQDTETKSSSSTPKRLCKQTNAEMVMNSQANKTPSLVEEKRKMWGQSSSQSSGSDCLEIIYDKVRNCAVNKVTGFSSKRSISGVKQRRNNNEKFSSVASIKDQRTNNTDTAFKNIRYSNTPENTSDFLSSKIPKENTTTIYLDESPWLKRKPAVRKETPSTPVVRKFFKTPLKERESSFKTPQRHNPWF